ncbi:MAG TPA: ABC transporter substrate-binding protein [Solirubrobacteraceae bacterium]
MPAKGRVAGACVAAAALLAGCGAGGQGGSSVVTVTGRTLSVYASQPPGAPTPQVTDILEAEQLALQQAQGKAGRFTVRLIPVHKHELSANARAAVEDPSTIAYLGELVPGTSQISTEILNQQGVLEISPADTAAYLTQAIAGVSNSLNTFYPGHSTYKQTFARTVPSTRQEAKALVAAMQSAHVSSVAVSGENTYYGRTLAAEVSQAARAAGLSVAGSAAQARAYFYAASSSSPSARKAAIQAFDRAAAAGSSVKLFAPSGLYDPSFVAGLSSDAQSRLFVSVPGILASQLSATGRTFVRDFTARFGHAPAPQAIFGYEAMAALLAELGQAKAAANQRATVVAGFRSLQRTDSVLGAYSLSGGDPSIAPLLLAHVRAGALVPFRSLAGAG